MYEMDVYEINVIAERNKYAILANPEPRFYVGEAPLLLLDQPVAAVDITHCRSVWRIVFSSKMETGCRLPVA
jgi:hypothetical protein